jgi:hypothetical protein
MPSPTTGAEPVPATATPSVVLSETKPITAHAGSSGPAAHLVQTPVLLRPESDTTLRGNVRFEWQWDGEPLPDGLAFDLLIWSEAEDQEHQGAAAFGVIEPVTALAADVDLDYVQSMIEYGGGLYYWTVIVVRLEPYERVGLWGEKRALTYEPSEPQAEPATGSP